MTKWEYKVIDSAEVKSRFLGRKAEDVEAYLNEFGEDGWEIVSMDYRELSGNLTFYCVAKREKPSE